MDDSDDEYDMSENALITTSEYCEPRWIQRDMLEDIPILKEGILWSRDPYLDRGDSSHPDDSAWGARNSDCAERLPHYAKERASASKEVIPLST